MYHRRTAVAFVLLGLLGCAETQTRLQSEDPGDRDTEVKTIGDVTTVANADSIPVSGVGLVMGLHGSGGGAPPGNFRTMMEDHLRKRGVQNIKELLSSPDNAVVLCTALIPPGARKGDPLDIEVTLPPQSKTTSLRGGYLRECVLFNYDSTKNLSPNTTHGDMLLQGHPLAQAEGPLLVGFGDGDESTNLKKGRVWGGGRCAMPDRSFYLAMNADQPYRVVLRVAERINETFQGPYRGPGKGLAEAKTKTVVYLNVPPQYHLNLPRFLRVVRFIPLQQPPANSPYRQRLEEELLDPAHTVVAALHLEALGTDSIPALKQGLTSKHVLVRFTSAEALAYLGSPSCGEELAKLTQEQPVLRAYCLTAMASLDEAVCHVKLAELMGQASPEVRYGAFRALRALDEHDLTVRGEYFNDSFWMHHAAPEASAMVHVSTSRRPEVVLFGEDAYLETPFYLRAGPEFILTAGKDDDRCTVGRFSSDNGASRKQCALKLEDVLRTMVELGGTYPDVVEMLRQADQCRCLTCRVAVDALPEVTSVYQLARSGENGQEPEAAAELLQTDAEVINARADFSPAPTLFDDGKRHNRRVAERDGGADGN